ncbi:hypothetical protein NLJ89_g9469 [Agrocybe chaxingu]|uniref:Uncharacterized protein n=1 Tax=Agrocybe chaxingu TaxID=84603 RepID=A0A9W8JQQ9_9AGAR|nr:hypothetical protein NLJ89_g9469 [Agrocybe chaxingu]
MRIFRSSPFRGQGFPVGDLQVRIEDRASASNEINPWTQESLPTLPALVQQLHRAPAHISSNFSIGPNANTFVSGLSNQRTIEFFTALYDTSQEARATSAFYEYHRSNPNAAAALLGDLAGGTKEEGRLMRFLLVSRGRHDWDAAMDLLDRMLRRELVLFAILADYLPNSSGQEAERLRIINGATIAFHGFVSHVPEVPEHQSGYVEYSEEPFDDQPGHSGSAVTLLLPPPRPQKPQKRESRRLIMSNNSGLPQELLDQIIDCLGDEYIQSLESDQRSSATQARRRILSSCAQASSLFYPRACSFLHSKVYLSCRGSPSGFSKRISTLADILLLRTSEKGLMTGIAPHIREFRVSIDDLFFWSLNITRAFGGVDFDKLYCEAREIILEQLNDDNLAIVLDRLHSRDYGPAKFHLVINSAADGIRWSDVSPKFQRAFRDLTVSPHLTSLAINAPFYGLPISLLDGTSITDLRLEQLGGTSGSPADSGVADCVEDLRPPQIQRFHTNHGFSIDLDPLTSPLLNLKDFTAADIIPDRHLRTETILKLASESLEQVHLEHSDEFPLPSLDLGTLQHLQHLSIIQRTNEMPPGPYDSVNYPPIMNACFFLEGNAAPVDNLVELKLRFLIQEKNVEPDFLTLFNAESQIPPPSSEFQWERLDRVLTTPTRFPSLKAFQLELRLGIDLDDEEFPDVDPKMFSRAAETYIRAALPRIASSASIALTLKVDGSLYQMKDLDYVGHMEMGFGGGDDDLPPLMD